MFLGVLLSLFVIARLTLHAGRSTSDLWRIALAGAMVVAGVLHFVQPLPFVQHLPPWVPAREAIIAVTGAAEILLGVGLLVGPRWRRIVGMLLALFLLMVFPGNVYVAVADIEVDGQPGGIYPWLRLLVQPALVWLAIWSTRDPGPDRAPGHAVPEPAPQPVHLESEGQR